MGEDLPIPVLKGSLRRSPGLARGAADERTVDLEAHPRDQCFDIGTAEWIIKYHDDLWLVSQVALETLCESAALFRGVVLNLALHFSGAFEAAAAEPHDRDSIAILC